MYKQNKPGERQAALFSVRQSHKVCKARCVKGTSIIHKPLHYEGDKNREVEAVCYLECVTKQMWRGEGGVGECMHVCVCGRKTCLGVVTKSSFKCTRTKKDLVAPFVFLKACKKSEPRSIFININIPEMAEVQVYAQKICEHWWNADSILAEVPKVPKVSVV